MLKSGMWQLGLVGKSQGGTHLRGSQVPGPVTPGQHERSLWDGRAAVTFSSLVQAD